MANTTKAPDTTIFLHEYEPPGSSYEDGPPLDLESAGVAIGVQVARNLSGSNWQPSPIGKIIQNSGRSYRVVSRERHAYSQREVEDFVDDGIWHGSEDCRVLWIIKAELIPNETTGQ
jgi:hypothetical protein